MARIVPRMTIAMSQLTVAQKLNVFQEVFAITVRNKVWTTVTLALNVYQDVVRRTDVVTFQNV